jgi:3-isopropylmalate dehydrogenase
MSISGKLNLAVMAGDGVGPEITDVTVDVLQTAADRVGLPLGLERCLVGLRSYEKYKTTLAQETLDVLKEHPGWILGPTSAGEYPKDDPMRGHPSGYLRRNFSLFANVRPVKAWPQLSPLIPDLDITVIRENTEGFYPDRNLAWGYGEFMPTQDVALSLRVITQVACDRFARFSFEYAKATGQKKISIAHKRTALPQTEGVFIGAFERIKDEYSGIDLELLRVDTFSSSMPRDHRKFPLVATTNLFGDILSDQCSGLAGGVGIAPSLNASTTQAMSQAVHGTAPDIAGKGIANPSALILSTAMLLRWFFQNNGDIRCKQAADLMEKAVRSTIDAGTTTPDLGGKATTSSFAKAVMEAI